MFSVAVFVAVFPISTTVNAPSMQLPCSEKYPSWIHQNAGPRHPFKLSFISLHTRQSNTRSEIWADQSETAFKLHQFPCGYSCAHWCTEMLRKWRNTRDWHKESKQRKMLSLLNECSQKDIVTHLDLDTEGSVLYCLHPLLLLPKKGMQFIILFM